MFYKKEYFDLLLKDIIQHLSYLYISGANKYIYIDLLNKKSNFTNIKRPYNINNEIFNTFFIQEEDNPFLKVYIDFKENRSILFCFDRYFKNIEIYLIHNNKKINIEEYNSYLESEYDLSSEPIFSEYLNIFLKKYIISNKLKFF